MHLMPMPPRARRSPRGRVPLQRPVPVPALSPMLLVKE